jgi:hypothetical protein
MKKVVRYGRAAVRTTNCFAKRNNVWVNISVIISASTSQISVRNNNTLVSTIGFPVKLFIIKFRHPINTMSV